MKALVLFCLALTSCAHQTKENVEAPLTEEPKPAVRERLVPGMTFGNVELQRKTLDEIRNAMPKEAQQPNCSPAELNVSDTWPLSEPSPSEFSNAFLRWTELWTFEICGGTVDVEVVYMLHKKSDTIDISVSTLRNGQVLELS